MNPLHPRHMRPIERRAEICRILALGLVRLRRRALKNSARPDDFPLHNPADRSGTAPSQRMSA